MKNVLVLLAEVCGLLIIFVLFLLILSYFKIITLPSFLPNQQPNNTQSQSLSPTPSPTSTLVDTSTITTKDSANNINLYKTYTLPAPIFSTENKDWQADGVFAGYGNNSLMLISSNSTLVFNLNAQTIFEEVAISALPGSSGATFGFKPYSDFNTFIKTVGLGKYVQVYYTQGKLVSGGQTVTKVDYIPSYQLK
jgi:hypothetical protein